jgi:hypothetical protein
VIASLNSIKRQVFVMDMGSVPCEEGTEFFTINLEKHESSKGQSSDVPSY